MTWAVVNVCAVATTSAVAEVVWSGHGQHTCVFTDPATGSVSVRLYGDADLVLFDSIAAAQSAALDWKLASVAGDAAMTRGARMLKDAWKAFCEKSPH